MKLRTGIFFSLIIHTALFFVPWFSAFPTPEKRQPIELVDLVKFSLIPEKRTQSGIPLPGKSTGASAREDGKRAGESEQTGSPPSSGMALAAVTEVPRVLREARIPYPSRARRAGVEGVVELSLVIDIDGRVKEAEVLRGPGSGLEEAAVSAVRDFLFSPARIGDEKVPVRIIYKYRFILNH